MELNFTGTGQKNQWQKNRMAPWICSLNPFISMISLERNRTINDVSIGHSSSDPACLRLIPKNIKRLIFIILNG
jgi:hypothetical protein